MQNSSVLPAQDVVISGSKIESILPTSPNNSDIKVIDGSGKFLMPGLFDMHVHHEPSLLPLFLSNGITAVRDCGNSSDSVFKLRADIAAEKVLAPRMFVSGKILEGDPPLWPEFKVIKNTAEAVSAVGFLKKKGADQVKVYHTLPPKLYKTVLKVATKQKLKVAGHVPNDMSPIEALDAGLNCIEHLTTLGQLIGRYEYTKATEPEYEGWYKFTKPTIDQESLNDLVLTFKSHDAYFCPTLIVHRQLSKLADYSKLKKETDTRFIEPKYVNQNWNPDHKNASTNIKGIKPLWFKNYGVIYDNLRSVLPELAKGATILAGSDTPNPFVVPGYSLLDELELMADSGLTNYQVLQAATVNGAKYLNVQDQLGKVSKGMDANLIILNKNPLESIKNIRSLDTVVLAGKAYSPSELEAKVEAFEPLG